MLLFIKIIKSVDQSEGYIQKCQKNVQIFQIFLFLKNKNVRRRIQKFQMIQRMSVYQCLRKIQNFELTSFLEVTRHFSKKRLTFLYFRGVIF